MSDQPVKETGPEDLPRITLAPAAAQAAATADGYPAGPLGGDVHILDFVKILYKRRWSAITVFLLVFVSATLYTLTATRIYEATTQVLIEKENTNVVNFKEAYEQNQVADDYYQTQYKILQSRGLAKRTMDALKLWNDPQFVVAPAKPSMLSTATDAVSRLLGSGETPNLHDATETFAQSVAIDRFLSNLTITPVRGSRLVDIKYRSSVPQSTSTIANELARQYIEQSLEFKFLASKEASDWLAQRLAEQRKEVEASEQALQRYREQTDAVALEDKQNIVVQKLADLNSAVTRAKTERLQKEAAYTQIRSVQNNRAALDTIPAILSNGFIQQQKSELADLQRQQAQLAERLGPNHPDMIKLGVAIQSSEAKIQGEIAKVVQAMRNDYEQALAQEQNLTAALDQQKRDALALNRKGIEYGVLQRDAASNRQIFDSLMQRTKETGISGELRTSNIRIVDEAEAPERPISPNVRNNVLLAFVGGLMLAVGLVFSLEYLDNRIKSPNDIKIHLGLPFLGMVPVVSGPASDTPMMNNGIPVSFGEAFRGIRTNVLFSSAEAGCRSLMITSTGPGEGKTVVAANLAVALAQAGQRVLLCDADMRKPRIHDIFSVASEPGLSNLMVGEAKASESVRQTSVPGLWVLAAGKHPPNPSELLGSRRFRDFVVTLRSHFDWIVIDTPPVLAVTDAVVVAHSVTDVVFVVGADMTSRHSAQVALEQIDRARQRVVGVVLNRVDLERNSYYYSQYYRHEYTSYYHRSA